MNSPSLSSLEHRHASWLLVLVLLLAALAYGRVLHGEFQLDDVGVIQGNPTVKAGAGALSRIDWLSIGGRPLTTATFALNYAAGRFHPWSYHLVNILIHLATTLLLWRLARDVLRRAEVAHPELPAAVAAGVFALHPLESQAVSYLSQRSESLASLFAVATVLLLCRGERAEGLRDRLLLTGAALVTFVAGFSAKIPAVVAPVLWTLLALALPAEREQPLRRRSIRLLSLLAPIVAVGILAVAGTVIALRGQNSAGFSVPGLTPRSYLLTQTRAILLYLRLLVWPAGQSVEHDLPFVSGLDDTGAVALGLVWIGVVAAASWVLARPPARWPGEARAAARVAGFGTLWWFVALAPSSSIIPVVDPVMEHRAYLASFGPILAATAVGAWLLSRLAPPLRARLAFVVVATVWSALAAATYARNAVWTTPLALWTDAVAKSPGMMRPRANLAFALEGLGDTEGAIRAYRQALTLPETRIILHVDVELHLGAALLRAGRPQEGAAVLFGALGRDPMNVEIASVAAIALLDLGRPGDAEKLASRILDFQPYNGSALNTLGEAFQAQGRTEEALTAFQRAAAIDPAVAVRHLNAARAASRLGRREPACEALRRFREAGGAEAEASSLAARLACAPP
jgi:tetratricopeptide (TPR) repeat protein